MSLIYEEGAVRQLVPQVVPRSPQAVDPGTEVGQVGVDAVDHLVEHRVCCLGQGYNDKGKVKVILSEYVQYMIS